MALITEFVPLNRENIGALAAEKKADGWRFEQILAVNTEAGIDLIYSYLKDNLLVNYKVEGIKKDDVIPSITNQFFSAFVFENETHDLFGVNIEGIAIDFGGNFYSLAQPEPMTIISPEQKAARDKAKKIAKAKAAQEKAAAVDGDDAESKNAAKQEAAEKKIKSLDPKKAAQVKAALAAKAARERAKAEASVEKTASSEVPAPTEQEGE